MFTLEELRKLDSKKILAEIKTVEKELFKAKFSVSSGQEKANHPIKAKRRYIAQMKTIMNEHGERSEAEAPMSPKSPASSK
jgi:ribosomal protein L29